MSPVPIEQRALNRRSKTKGQDAVWDHILTFGEQEFSFRDIYERMNCCRDTVKECLRALVDMGYVSIVGEAKRDGNRPGFLYKLIKAGSERPVFSTVTKTQKKCEHNRKDNMWRTIKMLRIFSYKDVSVAASTKNKVVSPGYAKNYVRALHRAGYLKLHKNHKARDGINAVYRFIPGKNTGPEAPVMKRNGEVYDPNLKQMVLSKSEGGAQ